MDGAAVTLDNWAEAPHNRWSFLNLDEVLPTRVIRTCPDPVSLPHRRDRVGVLDIATPRFDGTGRIERHSSVSDVIADTWTDGFLVMHRGQIVTELYCGQMAPDTRHLLMSVTKSIVGSVAACLVQDNLLDPNEQVEYIVKDLTDSGFKGATVRDLLDMRSGVRFNETYHDPDADVYLMEHAVGWRSPREDVPSTLRDFLRSLPSEDDHGGPFRYRSSETNALGWVCEEVSGRPMADLLSELVWRPMGAEWNAHITVDGVGSAVSDGGMSATLRDAARFGELIRRNGVAHDGTQVLPEWLTTDILLAAEDSKDAFAETNTPTGMPGGHYRNQFWVPYRQRSVVLCLGIHGQMVYINQRAGVTGVKLSTWPTAQNGTAFYDTLGAFEAIAHALSPTAESPHLRPSVH